MAIVETAYGRVDGLERGADHAFLGIPFAAPPVGELRFRAPEPPEAWEGVRPARAFEQSAIQGDHPIVGFASSTPRSEDCLYLNVYTPAPDGARRPVLFWIHGGGFTHGSGSELLYDGGPLAARGDVVVVTIHYRLGALGFLSLVDRVPGTTANAGLLDCVAALRWVRDNIEAFGGDPGNVTIFGESAGAAAVGTLLAMPDARGLFHRAVMQSGTGRAASREQAASVADAFLAELGLDRESAAGILEVPAEQILDVQSRLGPRLQRETGRGFGPAIDDATLLEPPPAAVAAGASAEVPLLIGTNRDEAKLFNASRDRSPIEDPALPAAIRGVLPKASEEEARGLADFYRTSRRGMGLPHENVDILDAVSTDARFRVPAQRFALGHGQHQPDTYLYLFTWESPARRGLFGSCHALEMPFVFGTLGAPTQDRFAGSGPKAERLSEQMMDAWLAFARTGKPSHEGIGAWSPYDAERRPTMVFGRDSGEQPDPLGAERAAIEGYV